LRVASNHHLLIVLGQHHLDSHWRSGRWTMKVRCFYELALPLWVYPFHSAACRCALYVPPAPHRNKSMARWAHFSRVVVMKQRRVDFDLESHLVKEVDNLSVCQCLERLRRTWNRLGEHAIYGLQIRTRRDDLPWKWCTRPHMESARLPCKAMPP